MIKNWYDELEESRINIDEEADLRNEDLYEEEGSLAGFEAGAEDAYDEFMREDASKVDWFDDE